MFFGLTALGPQSPFSAFTCKSLNISHVPRDRFRLAFDAVRHGASVKSDRLPVDYDHVRRCLRALYGFEASPSEIDLALHHLQERDGTFDADDWERTGIAMQNEVRAKAEESPVEYRSLKELTTDGYRNRRLKYSPQEKFRKPILTSQHVGWFKPGADEIVIRKPNITCPETKFAGDMIRAGVIF